MMSHSYQLFQSLCETMGCQNKQGYFNSYHENIKLFCMSESQCQHPLLYQPGFFIMFSGRKIGRVNEYVLEYDKDDYLLITTPYPIECETFATTDNPVTGLYFNLQPEYIFKLTELMKANGNNVQEDADSFPVGFDVTPKTGRLEACMERVLKALHSPLETDALMDGILEEIYFLLLQSKQGQILINFATHDGTYFKIAKAVDYIQAHFNEKLTMDKLAAIAGMSISAFHRAFKKSITDSPLQYIKKIRLNKAKSLIINDGLSAGESALAVGYESIPQFSREFKRYFGLPPSKAEELGYRLFV